MKRKEAIELMDSVAMTTYGMQGTMQLVNNKTGDAYEVDVDTTLAIVRGVLAWGSALLEGGRKADTPMKELKTILVTVGRSVAANVDDECE